MLNQSISEKSIRLLGKKTWIKFDPKLKYDQFILNSFDKIENQFINGKYMFQPFVPRSFKGKQGYNFNTAADELIQKKLNDNIRRLFKIKPSDRHAIIKQTISLLKDTQPITVARLDIKDFYESIDRREIIKFVTNEWLLSQQNRVTLQQWDKQLDIQGVLGLPRGMSLSATLSEIRIRDFDKIMKYENNVYFYARYVDDIIIFYSGNENDLKEILNKNLNKAAKELQFNLTKSKFHTFNQHNKRKYLELDYLGYKLLIEENPNNKQRKRNVKVLISQKKINKIKYRIRCSFISYARNRNFNLLISRLKFLSGNQYIIGDIERTKLKSGIYYNYPLITEFNQLYELDKFYKKLITCSNGPISTSIKMIKKHIGNQNSSRINLINSISFRFGFINRIMNNFSTDISKKIKRCW